MSLDDVDIRHTDKHAAVNGGHDIVVAVQLVDERDHLLCSLQAFVPVLVPNVRGYSHVL